MSQRKGFLLASFITTESSDQIQQEVQFIADNLNLTAPYIFLLGNVEDPTKKILTYNAQTERGQSFNPRLYTLRLHRKKQTNTLYTINALNLALAKEHEGASGSHLRLDWEAYRNTMLLTAGKKLQVYPIEVLKIFKIEPLPEEK